MPLVKTPVRWSPGVALQLQHPHPGTVVVQYLALRRLPDQLVPCRLDHLCFLFYHLHYVAAGSGILSCCSSRSSR